MDGATLVMSDRQGIEIDYCPECRGVWLDRGELDKIIERSATQGGDEQQGAWSNAPSQPQQAQAPRYAASGGHHSSGYQSGPSGQGYYKKKRKESWLSEIFD